MRASLLALVACCLAPAGCSPESAPQCPGDAVASFRLEGRLALEDELDPATAALVPDVSGFPDCTPDAAAPIQYPPTVAFDATLATGPGPSAAALCRPNGVVYAGERSDASGYSFSAQADPAVLCGGVCAAAFGVVIAGDVATDAGGAPATFQGILVEVLTASRGACDACIPLVPDTDQRTCAGRYVLSGTVVP